MTTPTLAREGARIGGVTATTAAFTCRTDSNGVTLSVELSTRPDFATTVGTVTAGSLTSGNNYQATAYVDELSPGRRYYWRIVADDGAGNSVTGTEPLHANSFKTLPDEANQVWRVGMTGCYLGAHFGVNETQAAKASRLAQNLIALDLDQMIHLGDIYYADAGTTRTGPGGSGTVIDNASWVDGTHAYGPNAWFSQVGSDSKTVDDSTVARHRTNFITTLDAPAHFGMPCTLGHFMAAVPSMTMWDDHDLGWDNCDDLDGSEVALSTAETHCLANGYQTAHEMFMDLNRPHIERESGRSAPSAFGDPEYYFVDIPPARFIVLDGRSYRDRRVKTDAAGSKTMLGATQLQWLLDRIDDNPHRFTFIVSPLAFDGDHGWFAETSNWDSYKGYSHERDTILNHIWDHGKPARTLVLSADAHNGYVAKYTGPDGDKPPIYEVMTSNGGWLPSYHGYTTGFSSHLIRTSETACATGWGAVPEKITAGMNNVAVVEGSPSGMLVKMVETASGGFANLVDEPLTGSRVVWSRRLR